MFTLTPILILQPDLSSVPFTFILQVSPENRWFWMYVSKRQNDVSGTLSNIERKMAAVESFIAADL